MRITRMLFGDIVFRDVNHPQGRSALYLVIPIREWNGLHAVGTVRAATQ